MNVFDFTSYKAYLTELFDIKSNRGMRKKVAEHLNCQAGYISQVLTGTKTHFSLEHIERIANYLELSESETKYLILLAQYGKAGSVYLENFFMELIKEEQEKSGLISKKISKHGRSFSDEEKAIYYSHWGYAAVHMAFSIDELQTTDKIKNYFGFSNEFTNTVISFLSDSNLIEQKGGRYSIGKTRIHLKPDSPFITSLHQNWRNRAIQSFCDKNEVNLHYSSILVLSKKDIVKIRNLILDFIKAKEEILIPSKEESLVALNIDYFKI